MDKTYWLGRQQASLQLAEEAANSQARLVHYDLAGRYGVMASSETSKTTDPIDQPPGSIEPARAVLGVKYAGKT